MPAQSSFESVHSGRSVVKAVCINLCPGRLLDKYLAMAMYCYLLEKDDLIKEQLSLHVMICDIRDVWLPRLQ